jgi:hypothetical protein
MQGLDAVLGRVQEWKAVHAAGSESAIAEELGLFLGRHAGRFLNEEPSLPVLVERVHPALATLVGREAAEILEERVLRTADLRGAPGFSF